MVIHHISLGTTDIDTITTFYKKYFGAVEYSTYRNEKTGLQTCFLQFDKGALLEVTTRPGFARKVPDHGTGFAHMAINAGDADGVDFVTQRIESDGYTVLSPPHRNGAGYYESTILDPDGNWVEITGGRVPPPEQP